jgi:cytochrome b561
MTRLEYSSASKLLHWLTALIIFGVLPAGFILGDLPEGRIQNLGYDLHRSFGFIVLLLAAARIAVRKIYGTPEAYAGLTPFERRVSTATHHSLYLLLILTPLLGWAATSAFPVKISIFWLFDLPPLAPQSEALSKVLFTLHKISAIAIIVLLVGHIGAALMHRLIKRDGVMERMLPARKS